MGMSLANRTISPEGYIARLKLEYQHETSLLNHCRYKGGDEVTVRRIERRRDLVKEELLTRGVFINENSAQSLLNSNAVSVGQLLANGGADYKDISKEITVLKPVKPKAKASIAVDTEMQKEVQKRLNEYDAAINFLVIVCPLFNTRMEICS